ncbi:RNA polymerase sigma factor [Streptomyces parvulus]|uniref:RNA polymerase sigma factor n=1 Tax=Streptomyces parvulus TaxID=146923 RepID=UPI0035716BEE
MRARPRDCARDGPCGAGRSGGCRRSFRPGTAGGRARRCVRLPLHPLGARGAQLGTASADEQKVDDVVQQILLAAWQTQHIYRPDRGPLVAWLSGITKHKINDAISARSRRRERNDHYARGQGSDKAHDTFTDQLPSHLDGVRLLQLLSGPQRQVLYLAYWHDFNQSEIAVRPRHARGHRQEPHPRRPPTPHPRHEEPRSRRRSNHGGRRAEGYGPVDSGAPG